ncbi:MAG: glycosyltransferase family 2 protein [Gammaproteobacteria bacterium]|nr:glycosyltransferase family 2 protein [Gammaproteobacteria bacterium]MCW5582800.1 glycosyltransferase family 2 protein [Gammaproteobacteria bacterium]
MIQPQVTILIPNYRTLELTKLCLRLIRKYTNLKLASVMVIDNDSQDASLDYLRGVSWVKLIERKAIPHEGAISSHSRALDLGLEQVITPYVLSMHTDTLVKHPQWLEFLISQIEKNPNIAGVGSWKLEFKSRWRQGLKKLERAVQLAYYRMIGKSLHGIEGVGKNYYYLRSHCAIYRMDLIKKLNLHFSGGDMVAGKEMHKQLIDAGYKMVFLPSPVLIKYLEHVNHATTVLNPELSTRPKSVDRGLRRIEKSLARLNARAILADASLD